MILNTFFVLNPMENLYKNKEELKVLGARGFARPALNESVWIVRLVD